MALSKKHFNKLADILDEVKPRGEPQGSMAKAIRAAQKQQWQHMVQRIADFCAEENPRFDRARFIRAAGFYGHR